jgi:hypothetical protein
VVEYERAKQALDALVAEHDPALDLNEATTRVRIINRLLCDCLGWSCEEITAEKHQDGDYLDYVLGNPERRAVLEAKRLGRHFDVPSGVAGRRDVAISTVRDYSADNKVAIDQVLRYCQKGGIPVAILCNGTQILAFLGSRQDGIAPLEGKALLFSNMAEMQADFSTLWDSLSRDGLRIGHLRNKFSRRGRVSPPPEPLSARLMHYPGTRNRSELETDVRILADLFLQDLVQEKEVSDEFLAECYCDSGALSQYALVSKEILRSRYSAVRKEVSSIENVKPRRGKDARLPGDVLSAALSRRPLILLGDVGVGKTIFLKHFIRIEAADVLRNSIVFYVDFIKESTLLGDMRSHLVSTMTQDLYDSGINVEDGEFVRAVYNKEINQFQKSVYGSLQTTDPSEYGRQELAMLAGHLSDSLEHLRRSLEHLRGTRGRTFVLVLDNIDHHELEFQERIFVIGQSFSETWPLAVFMSLRPDTFYKSRKTGSLTAYQPRVFTVEPPRVDQVISKRLAFAKKQLESTGRLESFPRDLTINSESLLVYLDVLIEAFRSNEPLKELVDNLSSGNVRQALDFISTFVGSGYVSTARILEAHKTGAPFILPIHEFMRAILCGEYSHYDPRSSAVPNILGITSSDGREHFALPILLALCQARSSPARDGYVDETLLYGYMQELGYTFEQIETQVGRGIEGKLLQPSSEAPGSRSLRVTAAGIYMHKRMLNYFTYIDAIVVDTPIVDPAVRFQIADVHTIHERLERGAIFRAYLDEQWKFEADSTTFSWPLASAALERDMRRIKARAESGSSGGKPGGRGPARRDAGL